MPSEDRQKIISSNRALRNIKNYLETLLENGVLSDDQFDTITRNLPAEASLSTTSNTNSRVASPHAPISALAHLSVGNGTAPPAYRAPSPILPPRQNLKPEIARATALYRYAEPGDCNFEVGDQIAVLEYMNPEWWMGRNIKTSQEGVFPVNYVTLRSNQHGDSSMEKQGFHGYVPYHQGQPQNAAPPPPGAGNPYNNSVPPMAVAEQPTENAPNQGGRASEMGKKFGKKLGNATIFGAGATLGGNLVNSIL